MYSAEWSPCQLIYLIRDFENYKSTSEAALLNWGIAGHVSKTLVFVAHGDYGSVFDASQGFSSLQMMIQSSIALLQEGSSSV